MTPSELLSCAPRIAPSKLARIRLLKCKSLGTLVPPGRDGKFLTIALDGKRGPPVRRLTILAFTARPTSSDLRPRGSRRRVFIGKWGVFRESAARGRLGTAQARRPHPNGQFFSESRARCDVTSGKPNTLWLGNTLLHSRKGWAQDARFCSL